MLFLVARLLLEPRRRHFFAHHAQGDPHEYPPPRHRQPRCFRPSHPVPGRARRTALTYSLVDYCLMKNHE